MKINEKEIERLAVASYRATEHYRALSMQNTAKEPDEREKQAVAYAIATAKMFEARRALDSVTLPNVKDEPRVCLARAVRQHSS